MKVHELAAWLQAFPDQDAEVQVFEHKDGGGYYMQGGSVRRVPFDPETMTEYTDFRGSSWVKPEDGYYNKRYLFLGDEK